MASLMKCLLIAGAVAFGTTVAMPTDAAADDYWDSYWGWYGDTYRPYYGHRHRSYYGGDGYFGMRYDPYGYGYGGYRPYYGSYYRPYYGGFYGGHTTPYPHNSLQVGPLHLDWR